MTTRVIKQAKMSIRNVLASSVEKMQQKGIKAAIALMTDNEIFDLVRRCYNEVNREYINEQIRIAREVAEKHDCCESEQHHIENTFST